MTIQEARRYGMEKLLQIYPPGEASTISDWVIEHITGARPAERVIRAQQQLSPEQEEQLQQFLDQLLTHEPVQYVLNEAWFFGMKFKVNHNTLIPRPETEELVEWVIDHCRFPLNELNILDIGTGSGCIAIALKRRLGKARVWACDLSDGALQIARENARNLGADVEFIQVDFLSSVARANLPSFDIIISNPPYIPEKDMQRMDPNVVNYEPHLALFVPDNDGLVFYRAIAEFGLERLRSGGNIFAEIYEGAGSSTADLFEGAGYKTQLKQDMQGKDRMIRAYRN